MKCSVYIAASVDGFIAREDGDISWLENPAYATENFNGLSYQDYIQEVDVMVMGRNSFEKVLSFGFWPYDGLPVVVLTHGEMDIPPELEGKVRVENTAPQALVEMLALEGYTHAYVDGGKTIQGFLRAGLMDEMTVTQIPVLLGSGILLFGEIGEEVALEMIGAESSDNGFVQVRYQVIK